MRKNKISNPVIKKASLADINNLICIQKNDGFQHAYYLNKERLKELFKRGEIFFIAFLGKEPVGFTAIDIEIRARMHFLSVRQEKKRQGIGTLLLEKIISESKKTQGKDAICLYLDRFNVRNFPAKEGF